MNVRIVEQTPSEPRLHRILYLLKFLRALLLHFSLLFLAIGLFAFTGIGGMYFMADALINVFTTLLDKSREIDAHYGPLIVYITVVLFFMLWLAFLVSIYLSVTNVWRRMLRLQSVALLGYGVFMLYSFWQPMQFSLQTLSPTFTVLSLLSLGLMELLAVDGAIGLWQVSRTPEPSSFIATLDPRLTTGPWMFVNKLLDLPRTPLRHWRTAVAYVLAVGSAILLITSLAYWINAGGIYSKISVIKICYEDTGGSADCTIGASSWGNRTLLWLVLAFVGIKLSGLMLSTAKRLGGLSVSQVLSRGEERFILYLRAFDVDDVILPTPRLPLLSNLVSLRPFPARVEDELFDVADGYRPLIAVGKPGTGRAAPSGGAYRAYLDDSGWQSYVLDTIRRAERIVIMLKNTDGVRWELSRILDQGALAKTLFLFDPSAEDPRQWQILAGAMLLMFDIAGVTLSAGSFQGQPLGFAVRDGQLIEFNNANWTATSYRTAFSHFLADR